jgi:hypothetical protein
VIHHLVLARRAYVEWAGGTTVRRRRAAQGGSCNHAAGMVNWLLLPAGPLLPSLSSPECGDYIFSTHFIYCDDTNYLLQHYSVLL